MVPAARSGLGGQITGILSAKDDTQTLGYVCCISFAQDETSRECVSVSGWA